MRIILYALIVSALLAAPVQKLDVARLEPVEVVYIEQTEEIVRIVTDTGAEGEGDSIEQAINELKNQTAGVVYLDTADYLIVNDQAIDRIGEMNSLMKGSVKLCRAQDPDMECAAEYLNTHGKYPELKEWTTGVKIPLWKDEKNSKNMENNT